MKAIRFSKRIRNIKESLEVIVNLNKKLRKNQKILRKIEVTKEKRLEDYYSSSYESDEYLIHKLLESQRILNRTKNTIINNELYKES